MRWVHPPEIGRERDRARFDPIVEGARHHLSREVSLAIWQHVCAAATDSASRCDMAQAQQRFHEIAARIAAHGGRLRPDVGRATRLATESSGFADALEPWPSELRIHTPGRQTLVTAELRRWITTGHAPAAPEAGDRTPPPRELPGAGDVAQAMAALLSRGHPAPARPVTARPAHVRRPRELDLRAWAPREHARDAGLESGWLARADRATQVREAARLHRAGELAEALRRGQPGLADAVAAALHDGAILAPHPVDVLRDSVRGLSADLTTASRSLGRAAARFLGATPLAPVGQRAFAAADAWTGGGRAGVVRSSARLGRRRGAPRDGVPRRRGRARCGGPAGEAARVGRRVVAAGAARAHGSAVRTSPWPRAHPYR